MERRESGGPALPHLPGETPWSHLWPRILLLATGLYTDRFSTYQICPCHQTQDWPLHSTSITSTITTPGQPAYCLVSGLPKIHFCSSQDTAQGEDSHLVELTKKGALILSSAAVFHPFPGHLMQGGCNSLGADPLQQTEPMPGGDLCS